MKKNKLWSIVFVLTIVCSGITIAVDRYIPVGELSTLVISGFISMALFAITLDSLFDAYTIDVPFTVGESYYTLIPIGGKWVVLEIVALKVAVELDAEGDYNGEYHTIFIGKMNDTYYHFDGVERSLKESEVFETVEEAEEEAEERLASGYMPVEVKDLCE